MSLVSLNIQRFTAAEQFNDRELSVRDVAQLNNAGIGIRIPLSNHYATREEYEQCRDLLETHHQESNSVIVTNDDLAKWIRADFPKYRIDASVIKNINTLKKLEKALKLYDEVVLPMTANEDWPFLKSIEDKHRIMLFANAGCAFTCPSKIAMSQFQNSIRVIRNSWRGARSPPRNVNSWV